MINIKSCVIQEQSFGCSIACIATVIQKTYSEIEKDFKTDFNTTGISIKQDADYLAGYGFDLLVKYPEYFGNGYDILNKRLLSPFADIHIVSLQQFQESTEGHAIVMTNKGILLDPRDGKQFDGYYLYINSVLGCFYPKGWKFRK